MLRLRLLWLTLANGRGPCLSPHLRGIAIAAKTNYLYLLCIDGWMDVLLTCLNSFPSVRSKRDKQEFNASIQHSQTLTHTPLYSWQCVFVQARKESSNYSAGSRRSILPPPPRVTPASEIHRVWLRQKALSYVAHYQCPNKARASNTYAF